MKVLPLVLAAMALVAGCAAPASTTQKPASVASGALATLQQAQAIVQKVGDNASARATDAVKAKLLLVGHEAAEPTIGVTKDGTLFYAASTFKNDIAGQPFAVLPRTDIIRSADGGASWKDVTPYFPGGVIREHPETGDPFVYVDAETGRVFDIDQRLLTTCYTVVTSDDKGATWTVPPSPACATPGVADHQSIVAAKPRALPTVGYAKVVYVCYNAIATSVCTRSLDGGRTFTPTGPLGTQGVQPDHAASFLPNGDDPNFLCSSLLGHLKAAPDGTVYVPRRQCDQPLIGITQDDGNSWKLVRISPKKALNLGGTQGMDPTIAVDKAGNVYYVFQADDGHLWLTTSSDHGNKWTDAVDITPAGVTWANLAAVTAGGNGTLALAYYGTDLADGVKAKDDAVEASEWHGYLAVIANALTPAPTLTTARANPATDPLYRGACGIGRCGSVRDFIDVAIDADGRPWATFVDACVDKCAAPGGTDKDSTSFTGALATLQEGPNLWDLSQKLVAIHAAVAK